MSGATQDRLAEVREKIDGARGLLAEVEKSPGSFDRPEHRKAEIREQLGRLQDMQVSLLQEFDGNGNGNGHGGQAHEAWKVEGLSSDQRIKGILDEVAASSQPFGRLPLGRSIGKFELARQLSAAKADIVAPSISRLGASAGIVPQLRRPVCSARPDPDWDDERLGRAVRAGGRLA